MASLDAFAADDTVCPIAFAQPLQPHVRVWDSVSLVTLQVIGLGTFERGVGCLDFSKAVRQMLLLGYITDLSDPSECDCLADLLWYYKRVSKVSVYSIKTADERGEKQKLQL